MSKIELYRDKNACCGCEACKNVCPKGAIEMQEDECGFTYPKIDQTLCVECGSCLSVCGYKNPPKKHPVRAVYAAASKDDGILETSASGGIFAVLSLRVIDGGGVVYGAAMQSISGKGLCTRHIRVTERKDIEKLQGSKYVQSEMGNIYQEAKEDILKGREVLFSGTPCQIAGLIQYMDAGRAHKRHENLLLVEVICHGVPSRRLFGDFLSYYGDKLVGKQAGSQDRLQNNHHTGIIKEFCFRDKKKGQGFYTDCRFETPDGRMKRKGIHGGLLSYVYLFLKTYIYRSNCYSCPFAAPDRISDLTIGDYWGFGEEYPEISEEEGLSDMRGVSCILVNTDKGERKLQDSEEDFYLKKSTWEQAARHNAQLREPSVRSERREEIFLEYQNGGYRAVDRYYRKNFQKDRIKYMISGALPVKFKKTVKKLLLRHR